MDTISTEDKFRHAVEIIKNLPKTGSFQPSNDLKLKFYSYFKQATEGPCDLPKPGFWDIISRAKWDAWSNLGEMSKEEAMENYVDEFIKIVKSTPFDERAHDYVHLMGPYIDLAPKEFQEQHKTINGTMDQNSPVPVYKTDANENPKALKPVNGDNNGYSKDFENENLPVNGHSFNGTTESDSDEFSDTYDNINEGFSDEHQHISTTYVPEPSSNPSLTVKETGVIRTRGGGEQRLGAAGGNSPLPGPSGSRGNRNTRRGRGNDDFHQPHNPNNNLFGGANGGRRNNNGRLEPSSDINEQLAFAVIRLQHTMEQVVNRLDSLEALLQAKNASSCVSTMKNSFWSVFGIPPRTAILILGWPLVIHWLIYILQKRRRR